MRSIKIPSTHSNKFSFFSVFFSLLSSIEWVIVVQYSLLFINHSINIIPFDVVCLIDAIIRMNIRRFERKFRAFVRHFIQSAKQKKNKIQHNYYSKQCCSIQRFEKLIQKLWHIITFYVEYIKNNQASTFIVKRQQWLELFLHYFHLRD